MSKPQLIIILILISACTFGPQGPKGLNFLGGREVASEKICRLEKHPREAIYQIKVAGKPYSEFWYDYDYGKNLVDRLERDGQCPQ